MEDKTRVGSLALSINKDETALLTDEHGNKVATIMVSPKHQGHRIQIVIQAPLSLKISRGVKN